jgi:4-oxalomesaconate tautomerase
MTGIRCMLMRGGTSKGAYFLAADLPADRDERDDLLLRIMGSPDPRQIDGIGGAHPLTSKVAVVSRSDGDHADVDYLFLQVGVDAPTVSDKQNCGNILAGIGPFALERGLVPAGRPVRIRMVNTGEIATATMKENREAGAGTDIVLGFESSGRLLPTGNVRDTFDGIDVTCVDAGMPVVVVEAASLGCTGYESVAELEADTELLNRVIRLRLQAAAAMGLGDVSGTTIPKVSLVAPPVAGGDICTRTFIPVRVHDAIGVLGAVSVAAAARVPGGVGYRAEVTGPRLEIEHPAGTTQVEAEVDATVTPPRLIRSGVVRTARKLFDGTVYPRESAFPA